MNSYKLEDIEELATQNGMRITSYGDIIHVYLGNFRVSIFGRVYPGVPQYELLLTYTNVINSKTNLRNIYSTGCIRGKQFFGDLYTVYENMYKKYKELLKTIKAAEIKNCGGEYVVG
jgi:hypothetical protein